MSVERTTVSRDPALVALLEKVEGYPGASAILDEADRAWLRARGFEVPDRAPAVPLTELARQAKIQRRSKVEKRKRRAGKRDT